MRSKWSSDSADILVGICSGSATVPEAMRACMERFPWATPDSIVSFLRRQGKPMPKDLVRVAKNKRRAVPTPLDVGPSFDEEVESGPATARSQRAEEVLSVRGRAPVSEPPEEEELPMQEAPDRFWVDQEDPDDFSPIVQPKTDWRSSRVLLVPDTHRPYHSRRAFSIMLQAAVTVVKPDTVVVLGDFGDFYAASQHDKDPRRARRLKEELDDVAYGLDALDSLPGVRRKIFCAGNHEWRQARYIQKYAPSLDGLVVSWEEYLGITSRGWELVPYKRIGVVGNLLVTHETGIGGMYAPKRVLDLAAGMGATDIAFGHTHRLGMAALGSLNGRPRLSISCGWLGNHKSADYVHAIQAFSTYNHGFAYAIADDTGHLIPGLAYIYGNRAHLMGQTVILKSS